jgi:ferredoxin--NADP+ reductase
MHFERSIGPVTVTTEFNATLIDRRDLNEGLGVMRIRPDTGRVPPFIAGQHVILGLPREDASAGGNAPPLVRRPYSIASSPDATDHLELLVTLVEAGRLTPRLWTLHEGDRLWMDERLRGRYSMEGVPADADVVMVSTGAGLAPHMSMFRAYRGKSRWRRAVMIHGVRRISDLAYRDEIQAACRENPSVTYIPLATREPVGDDWPGLPGRVQCALEPDVYKRFVGAPLDPEHCHVFLCGNPAMMKSVRTLLEERGFTAGSEEHPGNLHFERYG